MTSIRPAIFALVALAACAAPAPTPGNIDLARLRAADGEPGHWLTLGRNFKGDRFSPLERITTENATGLGFA